jgi:hypothetical protein
MPDPRTLLLDGNVIVLQSCGLYKNHPCAIVNDHHICPKSWFEHAGLPVQTPMITLCPNCHANVHAAIDAVIRGQNARNLPPRCRALAEQAFGIAADLHLTPRPTL